MPGPYRPFPAGKFVGHGLTSSLEKSCVNAAGRVRRKSAAGVKKVCVLMESRCMPLKIYF